jgi:hypothetical protein
MTTITKEATAKYNKTAYAKNKDKHKEICKKYYIENSETLKKKRIDRYNIQKKEKKEKMESPEYKLELEAKQKIKLQVKNKAKIHRLLKQVEELKKEIML